MTHATTTQQATGNQHARQLVVLTAAFFLFATLILFLVVSLAEETGEKQTTQTPTTQQATDNQHARQLVVLTAAFFLFATLVLFLVVSLAEETGEKQTTQPTTTQQATDNQHTRQPMIRTAAFFLFATLVLFLVVSPAEETGEKQMTQPTTTQQTTDNQHARQLVIRTAAFLLFAALVLFLVSLAEETGEKQTTHALTTQQAADSQLTDKLLLVSAALCFVILTKVYLFVEQSICTHYVLLSVCPSAPPCLPVPGDQPATAIRSCPWTVDNADYSRAPVPWPISVFRIARLKTSRRIKRLAALFSINGRSNKCLKLASFSDSTGSSSSAPSPKPQATPASNASSIMASSVALPIFFARLAFSSSESSCCARVPLAPSILMI